MSCQNETPSIEHLVPVKCATSCQSECVMKPTQFVTFNSLKHGESSGDVSVGMDQPEPEYLLCFISRN